jgi:hypothetical protein
MELTQDKVDNENNQYNIVNRLVCLTHFRVKSDYEESGENGIGDDKQDYSVEDGFPSTVGPDDEIVKFKEILNFFARPFFILVWVQIFGCVLV